MASQNNTGRQFDKTHAVTIVAAIALAAHRFISYAGGYPAAGGKANDSQGVSETAAAPGEALTVVTAYSYLVEAAETIAFGDPLIADATGRAKVATTAEHCGVALGAATQAGQLIEVQICKHVHA